MANRSRPKVSILALVLALGLLAMVVGIYPRLGEFALLATARITAARRDWPGAFLSYRHLSGLQPANPQFQELTSQAARQALVNYPDRTDLSTELALLRWFEASGDLDALAQALDKSHAQIPAGPFTMGSATSYPDERPQRQVYLDAYMIDQYEVTNLQYQRFLQATGRRPPRYWSDDQYPPGQADTPVVGVSWQDAQAYCTWAGERLPTEAEWEKACRRTGARVYPWGDAWQPGFANLGISNEPLRTGYLDSLWPLLAGTPPPAGQLSLRPVGSFPQGASPYEVLDLAGNVAEWVADWYDPQGYAGLPERNPLNLEPPWQHAVRDSAWFNANVTDAGGMNAALADSSRCSARNASHSADDPRIGFRCAQP